MCIQLAEWLWMYCVIVLKTCWFCIISQWVLICGLCVYVLCILCINCKIYLGIKCIMYVCWFCTLRQLSGNLGGRPDMKNTVCLCKLVICTVFQECGSRSYNVQCAIRLLSYVWNVLCMYLRFVCWDNLVANLGLYVKYCMHLYSIFVYRMYYVRRLVLFVEAIEWQSWKQTSPCFSSLIIIDWSYLNKIE